MSTILHQNNVSVDRSQFLYFCLLGLSTAITLIILRWILIASYSGLDITDESFYLNWFQDPWLYSGSISQFGFVYYPLFKLVNGDISLLRQCNILIIFSLSWLLIFLVFHNYLKANKNEETTLSIISVLLSVNLAICSLSYFTCFGWLPTPSYNSLILQSLLLVGIGTITLENEFVYGRLTGGVLIGIGGWLSFLAKPSSAVALAVVLCIYFLITNKFKWQLFVTILLTVLTLFITTAWFIDGTMFKFIERYLLGMENMRLMSFDKNLFRMDPFYFTTGDKIRLFINTFVLSALSYFLYARKHQYFFIFLIALLSFIPLAVIFNILPVSIQSNYMSALQLAAVPISAVILFAILIRNNKFGKLASHLWLLAALFFLFPFLLALGSSNNLWFQSQLGMVFLVLAGLILLMPVIIKENGWIIFLPLVIGVQLITVILLQMGMDHPYRQPHPLSENQYSVAVGRSNSVLKFSKEEADFLKKLNFLAAKKGLRPGTPMIDLASSPGILYMLGVKPIGQAWILGGYPWSERYAERVMDNVPCDQIASSWLLIEPESLRNIPVTVLKGAGVEFNTDYKVVLKYTLPDRIGGSAPIAVIRKQILLKPNRPPQLAIEACKRKRGAVQ